MASILHVINDLNYWLMHREPLAHAARKAGHRVAVAATGGAAEQRVAQLGYDFIRLPLYRFGISISDVQLFVALRNLFASQRFNIVHLMTIKPLLFGGLAAASITQSSRPKILGTVAGLGRAFSKKNLMQQSVAIGLRRGLGVVADAITFENSFDRDVYVGSSIVDASQAVVFKGAGVDLSIFVPSCQERIKDDGQVCFLFASRLLKSKGIREYVEAARHLHGKYKGRAKFIVAGLTAFDEPDGLSRAEVEILRDDPCIEWFGEVKPADMPKLMQMADVFVLPTRYQEGIPRACIEAGACGLAVIVGDVPGTRELIKDGLNGILLPTCDASHVAKAMEELAWNKEKAVYLGERLRSDILVGGFDAEYIHKQFLSIYAQMIEINKYKRSR